MLKDILITLITRIFILGLSFILLLITTHFFGSYGRGYISILNVSVNTVVLFSGFICSSALVYLIPRNKTLIFIKRVFIVSFLWTALISFIIPYVLVSIDFIPKSMFIHSFILGIFASILSLLNIFFLSIEKIFLQNLNSLLNVSIQIIIILVLVFIFSFKNINSYLFSLYISYGVVLIMSYFFVIKSLKDFISPNKQNNTLFSKSILNDIRLILSMGFIVQMGNISQYLNYRLSLFILNYFTSLEIVGIFSVAITITELIWTISKSIALVLYPRISHSKDKENSINVTLKLAKFALLSTILFSLILFLLPSNVYGFIFGKDFLNIKEIILILLPGVIIFSYSIVVSHYFAGEGMYNINLKASFLGFLVTSTLCIPLVYFFGIKGAAFTTTLSYSITAIYTLYKFKKVSNKNIKDLLIFNEDIKYYLGLLNKNIYRDRKV